MPDHPPFSERDVLAAADRLIAAFAATDTDAYFAAFHPGATFVFHTEPATLPSRAAYQDLWAGWIDAGWTVVSCDSSERVVTVVGDTAAFSHRVHTVTETDGEREATDERETIVFVRTDAGPLAVHEHLSVAGTPVTAAGAAS
ncbi:nuclear transport factor 2 family protein [Tsukamurella sp. 8F]|uniref:nuclear transport factor 2 family protein n=1 Tax=unclassified Tsukamurella TaxID=2633480 RepID=UPI0023B9474B|nr:MULTISPECIES: nuclear transport factor 2 family protein [unclassified Tsukamurella]MDF0529077.1 nuclear transport factor 2 family protein [Tsukamurella sp. 8J]MDF0587451.1 nuclear transport factor 2 family protein [Tsukamurella sp. 8F]